MDIKSEILCKHISISAENAVNYYHGENLWTKENLKITRIPGNERNDV